MDWGTVPAWVAAVFGGGALAATAWQLRLNRKDRITGRKQAHDDEHLRQEAMARAVGVKVLWRDEGEYLPTDARKDGSHADVVVANSGPYPITSVVLVLPMEDEEFPQEVVYGTVLAGERLEDTWESTWTGIPFALVPTAATLWFTDTYGNHWARTPYDLQPRPHAARTC